MADRPTFAHWLKILLIASLLGLNAVAAGAVEPTEVLADPVLEARARTISKELRCLVCQNQSIDDSDAELARDLRILVRERLVTGDTDSQVVDYVVSRYGDFVLLKPPLKSKPMSSGSVRPSSPGSRCSPLRSITGVPEHLLNQSR